MGRCDFEPIFDLLSLRKIVYTTGQANKLKSLSIQNNTENGIRLQAHRGGTRIGNELIRFFKLIFFLFQLVSFTVDGDPLTPTGSVDRYTSHVIFLMHFARLVVCILHGSRRAKAQGVSVRVSFHLHVIHDVMCWSVRWSFLLLFLSFFHLFSSTSSLPHSTCSLPGTPS